MWPGRSLVSILRFPQKTRDTQHCWRCHKRGNYANNTNDCEDIYSTEIQLEHQKKEIKNIN